MAQVLHLLNSPEIQAKLRHATGRVARLVASISADEPLVEELYLTFYSRLPTGEERAVAVEHLLAIRRSAPGRRGPGLELDEFAGVRVQPLAFG